VGYALAVVYPAAGNLGGGGFMAVILIGAPSLEGKPVGNNRFYGANDPRGNTGLAKGY
jgi:hypothetical protein